MHIETIPVMIGGNRFFTENCYLASATDESACVIAIDPGDEPEAILGHLGSRSLAAIIITHGHEDHTGAIPRLIEHTGASLYAHEGDLEWLDEGVSKHVTTLSDGELLDLCDLKLLVMHTPGHSQGSICLYSSEDSILISGDTLFKGTCGRTDLPGGNPSSMHDTLALLSALPPETRVYPGHDAPTSIGGELDRGLAEY
ncbi:MAG: MBL fold metallo-hydrolase [Coriobacteriia bacterium]|nr:MBL fold metallo-hydrolase [Coriobacteriia bacterium]